MSDLFTPTALGSPLTAPGDVHRVRPVDPHNPNQGDAASQHKQDSKRRPHPDRPIEDSVELSDDAQQAINTPPPVTTPEASEPSPPASPPHERFQTIV